MLYHFSLQAAGLVAGCLLVLLCGYAFLRPELARGWMVKFPRSRMAGIVLVTIALVWSWWLVLTMEMGEFTNFRKPLLILLPIAYFLTMKFVDEFLAVRALGMLCLLAAEPLLDAAFLRYEHSRLLVTVFAYVLIVAGLFWVSMPYLLRDQIDWVVKTPARRTAVKIIGLAYGAAIVVCAIVVY